MVRRVIRSSVGLGLMAATEVALAQPSASVGGAPPEVGAAPAGDALPEPEASESPAAVPRESLGSDAEYADITTKLFMRGRYADAAARYENLFDRIGPNGPRASLAYAIAQCHRYDGDFASAFHFYREAALAYGKRDDAEAQGWRAATLRHHLPVVLNNLAVVRVSVPAIPGRRLCAIEIDGAAPVRYRPEGGPVLPDGVASSGVDPEHLKRVVAGLVDGGLAGARGRGAPVAPRCYSQDVVFVVDSTRYHQLRYEWRGGTARVTGSLEIERDRFEDGRLEVDIGDAPAKLSLSFEDAHGKSVAISDPELKAAFLRGASDGPEVRVVAGATRVAYGAYRLRVNVRKYREKPRSLDLTLLPGEARTVPVELTPPWYKRPWFYAAVGLVVVGAGAAVTYELASRERPTADLDRGNMGWRVEVP